MPTVLRIGRFRFYSFSNEREEPPHIHVKAAETSRDYSSRAFQRDRAFFSVDSLNQAKFWLSPTQLASSYGFSSRELTELERLVEQNELFLQEVWNEYFR